MASGTSRDLEKAPKVVDPINTTRYNDLWIAIKSSQPNTHKKDLLPTLYATWHKVKNDEEAYHAELKKIRIEAGKQETKKDKQKITNFFLY